MLPPEFARASCALLFFVLVGSGCCFTGSYRTPSDVSNWQDPRPPKLLLREKAQHYQERIEKRHLSSEGLLQYRIRDSGFTFGSYGDLADGPFQTRIYLSSQAHRYAVTKAPAAREQVLRALNGLRMLMEVTGKRGLLARYFSLRDAIPEAERTSLPGLPDSELSPTQRTIRKKEWRQSPSLTRYWWRADVSKDQYAGFIHGLGVTFALLDDAEIRSAVAELAAAAADHLIDNHMRVVDWHGRPTTYGDLSGRIFLVPVGVNALCALSIAKVAAVSTNEARYRDFYQMLVAKDYPLIAYWAQVSALGWYKRVNDNMGYLSLYPVLLLEDDPVIQRQLKEGERRSWRTVGDEYNAFFSFVHGGLVGERLRDLDPGAQPADIGREKGREALLQYPDDKRVWPIDLTRKGFNFPRAFFRGKRNHPRSSIAIPLYLRVRSSCFWASDPYRMVGRLAAKGETECSGQDYLLAYWMGRYHGFVEEDE